MLYRRSFIQSGSLVFFGGVAYSVLAQSDAAPLQIVVPTPPGGNVDLTIRRIAPLLALELSRPVVVVNRPGAATVVGTEMVARAPADGLTLLATAPSFAINPLLVDVRYKPFEDFQPLIQLTREQNVLVMRSLPAGSKAHLRALMDTKGSSGLNCAAIAGPPTIACGWLEQVGGVGRVVTIPYNGAAPALNSLLAGDTDIMFGAIDLFSQHLAAGKLVLVDSSHGFPLPELPSSLGIVVARGTPNDLIVKYNLALNRVLQSDALREALARSQQAVIGGPPEVYGRELSRLYRHYDSLIKTSKLK